MSELIFVQYTSIIGVVEDVDYFNTNTMKKAISVSLIFAMLISCGAPTNKKFDE